MWVTSRPELAYHDEIDREDPGRTLCLSVGRQAVSTGGDLHNICSYTQSSAIQFQAGHGRSCVEGLTQ